jgi:hypothetical protein
MIDIVARRNRPPFYMRHPGLGHTLTKICFSIAIATLFVIPHAVRIARIGSFHDYTPYTASSPSATVADETFMYVSEVNFMLQRSQLAYDTDAYEHRNEPFTYSVLPAVLEAGIAEFVGDLRIAQIVCHFFFPAVTAWLLITLFCSLESSISLAALLSLAVLVFGFSLRTVFDGNVSFILYGFKSDFIETLQAARNPHPNISFLHFVGAAMCTIRAIKRRSVEYAIVAGLLGGLLFYSYSFYAIAWTLGCCILVGLSLSASKYVPKCVMLTLVVNTIVAVPYFIWMHASKLTGAYTHRAQRLGLIESHLPSKSGIELSLMYVGFLAVVLIAWQMKKRKDLSVVGEAMNQVNIDAAIVTWTCMAFGGICGLNMQVVTGFNIEPEHHFPHMVIQPCVLIVAALLFLYLMSKWRVERQVMRTSPYLFFALFAVCCVSQINSGYNSAEFHRVRVADRQLFGWLQQGSDSASVVSTTNMRLNITIPDYTHNGILVANGSRSSGSDQEIVERFLLANALASVSPEDLKSELTEDYENHARDPRPVQWTYSYYMFEHSPLFDSKHGNIRQEYLPRLLQQYDELRMNLSDELRKYRVDFLFTSKMQMPASIPGWQCDRVLDTEDGTLWRLQMKDSLPSRKTVQ